MLTALRVFLFFTLELFRVFSVYKGEKETQIKPSSNKEPKEFQTKNQNNSKRLLKLRILLGHFTKRWFLREILAYREEVVSNRGPLKG